MGFWSFEGMRLSELLWLLRLGELRSAVYNVSRLNKKIVSVVFDGLNSSTYHKLGHV